MALFLPGQVVESIDLDEDFSGFGLVMNQEFTDSLNLPVSLQERLFIKDTQFYSVSEEVLDALSSVYRQVSSLMNQPEKCERFMSLVAENFKTRRDIGFYADKLCVTSKYLSTMLKQEISDELDFFNPIPF